MYGNNFYGEIGYGGIPVYYQDYTSSLSDTLILSEVFATLKVTPKAFTEIIIISGTLAKYLQRSISETITLVDTIAKYLQRALSGTITLVDTLTKKTTKVLTGSITLVETLAKYLQRSISESFALVSTSTAYGVFKRTLSDTLVIVDSGITKLVGKVLTGTITVSGWIRRYINGLLVNPWNKIVKTVASFTKTAKPAATYSKEEKTTDSWSKDEKPY